jgi:hypothetical protein
VDLLEERLVKPTQGRSLVRNKEEGGREGRKGAGPRKRKKQKERCSNNDNI